jgi:cob(I)alamin adenosyltransferase
LTQGNSQEEIETMSDNDADARHTQKMKNIKAAREKMMAEKNVEKGLLIVHTGNGKGKSSAALGMVFRHIAYEMPVAVVQFTKSPEWVTGEAIMLERFPDLVSMNIMGEGFTWDTQDRQRDIASARAAWEQAKTFILDDRHKLVMLDELNIVLRYDYLPIDEVVAFLRDEKPADKHVVVTGRNAKPELIEIADLVTEMTNVKHPFKQGVKAQKGIEY